MGICGASILMRLRSSPSSPAITRRPPAILRLAESLDRSHSQPVSGLELHDRGEDGLLQLRTSGDAELELWAGPRHAAAFERLIGKPLRVEVSSPPASATAVSGMSHVEQPHDAARVSGETVRRRGYRR